MPTYFDLKRRFVERPKYDPDELVTSELTGNRVDWSKVLAHRFSVVVAPANFGKTTEMRRRAVQMRNSTESAVFVALRRMADRGSLEKALEVEELAAYRAWKAAPSGTLTLFVDSLDEAMAGKKDDIEYLVSDIANELSWPNERVNWVISTRPAVLTSEVLDKLTKVLVIPAVSARPATPLATTPKSAGASTTMPTGLAASGEPEKIRLFSMVQLDSKQADSYLMAKYSALSTTELLRIARERGLAGFTTSPGGLDILARIDLLKNPPQSLTEVFQRVVGAVYVLRESDHRLECASFPVPAALAEAAQKLAGASQVCQLVNIEMPEEKLAIPEKALSARLAVCRT